MMLERNSIVKLLSGMAISISWPAGALNTDCTDCGAPQRAVAAASGACTNAGEAYWRPADDPPAALWALANWPLDPVPAKEAGLGCGDAASAAPRASPTAEDYSNAPAPVATAAAPADLPSEPSAALAPNAPDDLQVAVSDDRLDSMRGGFDLGNGLQVNFGFEQIIFINGQLIATNVLNLSNLSQAISNQVANQLAGARQQADAATAAALKAAADAAAAANRAAADASAAANKAVSDATAAAGGAVKSALSPGNTTASAASSSPPTSAGSAAGVGASTTSVSGSTVSGTFAQSVTPNGTGSGGSGIPATVSVMPVTNANGHTLLIQNGPGNVVLPGAMAANSGLATVIQNTVNDQRIQMMTILNAELNSLQVQRAQMFNSMMRDAMINAMRR